MKNELTIIRLARTQEDIMSTDTSNEENLTTTMLNTAKLKLKEASQLFCLCALLSTYLFVMLKPSGIQNHKALGGK
ncbi:MAG: hypothetical protein ACJAW2_000421 [Shewanella sp.]|jgi:hypothetical protein